MSKYKNKKQIEKLAQENQKHSSINLKALEILTHLLRYKNDRNLLNILWLRNIHGQKIEKLFASCYNNYHLFTQTIYLLEKNIIDMMEQDANLELNHPIPFFTQNNKPLNYTPSIYEKKQLRTSFEIRLCGAIKIQNQEKHDPSKNLSLTK